MKVLFDEGVPHKLARHLPAHSIQTVAGMQWGGVTHGALLKLIEQEKLEVFLTGDKNMISQQRLLGRPFAVLILSAINWPVIRPHIQAIDSSLGSALPGTVKTIDCDVFRSVSRRQTE